MKGRTVLLLSLLALALLVARLHTWAEPLERDLTAYAVIGHGLMEGRELYSQLWDHKPPAVHVTYALGVGLAGPGPGAVYLLNVVAAVLAMLALFRAGEAFDGRAETGLWAAGFLVIVSGDLRLQGNQPNVELFMNACQAWAVALWLEERDSTLRPRRVLAIAALFALASLYKQIALVVLAAMGVAHLLAQPDGRGRRLAAGHLCVMGAVAAAAWVGVSGWFAARGRLHDFVAAVVTYNRFYAGDLLENVRLGFGAARLAPPCLRSAAWPLAVMALVGLASAARRAPWAARLAVAVAFGTALEVALPGRFYPHYYQLWLPPLCCGAAWGVAGVGAWPGRRAGPAALAVGTLTAACLLAHQAPHYLRSPEEWSQRKYGPEFVDVERMGRSLALTLRPDETFFAWCDQPGLYFAAGRLPPTRMLYVHPLLSGPLTSELEAKVLDELDRAPPELLVVQPRAYLLTARSSPVSRWFLERYRPLTEDPCFSEFEAWVRRGGRLDRERPLVEMKTTTPGASSSGAWERQMPL